MPSTKPNEKYGAQLIILFAPDQGISDNNAMLMRGFNQLGWTENGPNANMFVIEWDRMRLAMRAESAGAADKKDFDKFKKRLAESGGEGRIYLNGHGDWASQTLAGRKAEWVAEALKAHCPPVKLISVIGCGLGRDLGSNKTLISSSMNSFGSILHRNIKGFCAELFVRVLDVAVDFAPGARGQKGTGTINRETLRIDDALHHRPASKLKFFWDGGQQKRDWVLYSDNDALKRATDDDIDRLLNGIP